VGCGRASVGADAEAAVDAGTVAEVEADAKAATEAGAEVTTDCDAKSVVAGGSGEAGSEVAKKRLEAGDAFTEVVLVLFECGIGEAGAVNGAAAESVVAHGGWTDGEAANSAEYEKSGL
jgi:hypothetical protein